MIPDDYKKNVNQHIEGLRPEEAVSALRLEINEGARLFPGGQDDQPVQAILNAKSWLSEKAKDAVRRALANLVADAIEKPDAWEESAHIYLLSLVAGFPVPEVKNPLKEWTKVTSDSGIIFPHAMSTIAALSDWGDIPFWKTVPEEHPAFAGMAFQVLLRLHREDALGLLYKLIPNQGTAGSIVRGLSNVLLPRECSSPRR